MYIIPVHNTVVLPDVQYRLALELLSKSEIAALQEEEYVILLPLKEWKERSELHQEDFQTIGVISEIRAIKKDEEKTVLAVESRKRVDIINLSINEAELKADFRVRPEIADLSKAEANRQLEEIKAMLTTVSAHYQWGPWINQLINKWSSLAEAISMISPYLELEADEKYAILEADSASERSRLIKKVIWEFKESLEVKSDMAQKMKETQNTAYREAAIHKQMEILQKELDEMNPEAVSEEDLLRQKISAAGMPKEAEKEVMRVFNRFKQEGKNGHEYGSLYDYLDFVTTLAWKPKKAKKINLEKARAILNKEHYGLEEIKERILQQLAIMSLRKQQAGSIVLFVGAPGTGKTSIGKSIAKALEREYVRISFGGIRDEAEIRGHRRTYIGAMPGRIMDGVKRSGVMNPVVVLDEIDKLSSSYHGDPAGALLEVLDPEQNGTFTDHYMNIPYDLSHVLFLCTANTLDGIPQPLLDRMEVIQLSGYTPVEKFHIAKKHLLVKSLADAGMKAEALEIPDQVLHKIIAEYTLEAGVRGLKKRIDQLCRRAAVLLIEGKTAKVTIAEKDLAEILGRKTASHDQKLKKSLPGVATGLAWTQVGGEILFIETTVAQGSGRIHITGQLGDVMRESAEIAVSLLKSVFYHEKLKLENKDIHIHIPSGAVPKDGPSAGITLFTALVSLVTQVPVDRELAMTGEVSLRGQVLPIGGLTEKLMAAERAGIKQVLIPVDNQEDLQKVPEDTLKQLDIIAVDTIEEVILHALHINLPQQQAPMLFDVKDKFQIVIPAAQKGQAEAIPV